MKRPVFINPKFTFNILIFFITTLIMILYSPMAYSDTINGSFGPSDCLSIRYKEAHYADVYTFTLSSPKTVVLELATQEFRNYIYLYAGSQPSGSPLIADENDPFAPYNSGISRELGAGSYCIEVTTYERTVIGDYILTSSEVLTQSQACTSYEYTDTMETPDALCIQYEETHYADVYTFTLSSPKTVVLELATQEFRNYIYLYAGSQPSGSPIKKENDPFYPYVSGINMELEAGSYAIEVTTYERGESGGYNLISSEELIKLDVESYPYMGTLTESNCLSIGYSNAHYADAYTFTLSSPKTVVLELATQEFRNYIYLYTGIWPSGSLVLVEKENDPYYPYFSGINRELDAGTYSIEVTTYESGETGSYDLVSSEELTQLFCYECGNGIREDGEDCDGIDLGGETCESLGYKGGILTCSAECTFDTSKCICPSEEIYGSASEEVYILRMFRDNILSQTSEGKEIIKLYYQWGPVIFRTMEDDEFKKWIKENVDQVLPLIKKSME